MNVSDNSNDNMDDANAVDTSMSNTQIPINHANGVNSKLRELLRACSKKSNGVKVNMFIDIFNQLIKLGDPKHKFTTLIDNNKPCWFKYINNYCSYVNPVILRCILCKYLNTGVHNGYNWRSKINLITPDDLKSYSKNKHCILKLSTDLPNIDMHIIGFNTRGGWRVSDKMSLEYMDTVGQYSPIVLKDDDKLYNYYDRDGHICTRPFHKDLGGLKYKKLTKLVWSYGFYIKLYHVNISEYLNIGISNYGRSKMCNNVKWSCVKDSKFPSWIKNASIEKKMSDTLLITMSFKDNKWQYTDGNTIYPTVQQTNNTCIFEEFKHVVSGDLFCIFNKLKGMGDTELVSDTIRYNTYMRLVNNYIPLSYFDLRQAANDPDHQHDVSVILE